jgi:hypothetical protein
MNQEVKQAGIDRNAVMLGPVADINGDLHGLAGLQHNSILRQRRPPDRAIAAGSRDQSSTEN